MEDEGCEVGRVGGEVAFAGEQRARLLEELRMELGLACAAHGL